MNKLLGNEKAYRTLAAYLRGGRLPHAVLIEGQAGSGKRTFARTLAAGALCIGADRPCGSCAHCVKAEKDIHPDLLTFGGEGGARSFHIDTVRAIRKEAHVSPNEASAKVFILRDVQDMSVQAQNALLKIIEEPPGGVTFILTCINKAVLLETILSRVAVIGLELPDIPQCEEVLPELVPGKTSAEYHVAAVQAQGNVGKAIALLSDGGMDGQYQLALQILTDLCVGSELDALAALSRYERDRGGFASLLGLMKAIVTGLLLEKNEDETLQMLQRRVSRLQLLQITDIIDEIVATIWQNVNGLLLVTILCSKIKSAVTDR